MALPHRYEVVLTVDSKLSAGIAMNPNYRFQIPLLGYVCFCSTILIHIVEALSLTF